MHHRGAWQHRRLGIEDGGQDRVVDGDRSAGRLGHGLALGDDGGHTLAGEADHRVEHQRVVDVVGVVLVAGGGEMPGRVSAWVSTATTPGSARVPWRRWHGCGPRHGGSAGSSCAGGRECRIIV